MGCGAVCGNNSSIYEPNQFSHKILLNLIPQLKYQKDFLANKQFHRFIKQVTQNPLKYRLKLAKKLLPKQEVDPGIITKWKVVLYCLDTTGVQFRNCLGQNFRKNNQQSRPSQQQNNQPLPQSEQTASEGDFVMSETATIFQHKQFSQIEKDIDRTCNLPQQKKKTFERILKRISNYFPQMGYTQGINFIVGYLMMIGLGEFDVFWMFVHIAISKRYLLLGLFEDKFPLSEVYKHVFKNILRRVNSTLYQHLYQELNMDESVWVFKWFITYFIYSFPFEMIKYVFDMVIHVGGLGLVKFAIAITEQLSTVLMEIFDVCEISIFFQSLREIDTFNQYIDINKVVEKAYCLEIKDEDFRGIQGLDNFYSQFIMANIGEKNQGEDAETALVKKIQDENNDENNMKGQRLQRTDELLKQWYQKLLDERQAFVSSNTKSTLKTKHVASKSDNKPFRIQLTDKRRADRPSIQGQLRLHLVTLPQVQQQMKSPHKEDSVQSNKNSSVKDSIDVKKQSIPSTGCSYDGKVEGKNENDSVSEIDQLWDEEDRSSSVSKNLSSRISQQSRTQNGFKLKPKRTQYEDQLDKFASTHCNPLGKSKQNINTQKTSSIFFDPQNAIYKPKINNFQTPLSGRNKNTGHLIKAAESMLGNLSNNDQSQYESSNSEYSKLSQKEKKSKENDLYSRNYLKNKMKKQVSLHHPQTEIASLKNTPNIQSQQDCNSSSRDSCIDPQNSFYVANEFIHEEQRKKNLDACSVRGLESHRFRVSTQQDIVINSLCASHVDQNRSKGFAQSRVSQIQIFQAPQIFKKKNRVSTRIDGAQRQFDGEVLKAKLSHAASNMKLHQMPQRSIRTVKIGIEEGSMNYEESYESIFVPSEGQKSNTFRFQEQLQKYQIESVK